MINDFIDDADEDMVHFEYREVGNTLVVCGGVGAGKSAAIHACTQELGWTVLEIYPGIGKRGTGANGLAGWVGDARMNHLVDGKADKNDIAQSVILLDQVDMWFEQDSQFWTAVQNLVNGSMRGVIMTTNDIFAYEDQFPVHRYPEFDQVDPDLASSYLYAQARAAILHQAGGVETEADVLRRLPSRQAFRELFHRTASTPRLPSFALQDIPMHPHPSQMDRLRNLGRAVEEVKFWVVHGRNCQEREEREPLEIREAWDACGYDIVESLGDWSQSMVVKHPGKTESVDAMRLERISDALSWVDAHLERRWDRQLEAAEADRYEPGPDDQAYHKQVELCKPFRVESFGIAEYCADADIALTVLCLARRRLERGGAGGGARRDLKAATHFDARWLEEDRSEYQERLLTFLETYILSEATHRLPHAPVVLDVLPAVRRMVAIDDEFEKEAEKGPIRVERGGRPRRAAAQSQKVSPTDSALWSRLNYRSLAPCVPPTCQPEAPTEPSADEISSKRRERDEDEAADSPGPGPRPPQSLDFNYNMRRHSIAAVPRMRHPRDLSPLTRSPEHTMPFLPPPAVSGQKRKLVERPFPTPMEPTDPRFPGAMAPLPGIDQGPMLKRRGSAFDPRVPNIYERRDSIGAAPWLADRRDSTASIYSNTSIASSVGYTTANSSTYSPDTQLHNGNKPGQVYAWPDANNGPSQELPQRSFPSFSETHANGTPHNFVGNSNDRVAMQPVAVPSLPSTNGERRASGSSGSDAPSRRRSQGTTPEASSQPTVPSSEANASGANSNAGPRRDSVSGSGKETPYSRSPELRVSHKLAERKRRKEMKDLFDELRDHLPADRGMKASKWEILSKAVDYIGQLKQSYAEVTQELDMARHELEAIRPGSITGHHPVAPHHPHPHPGYALPYGAYPVSNHYSVQPGAGLPPPPSGPQPPPA
ncbi:Protein esc1 [Rhizoctonia solani AG-1 IB]|uniref:Protein esc1 n=1 Tax=Thanatephorus cucumeris (strain AG1-IB / isolate 7/3/14) TaxID=1108050 RepID=M5BHY1_THACB|nr:Protein esc1 [Rhizoctonia solani AG-1 IB]